MNSIHRQVPALLVACGLLIGAMLPTAVWSAEDDPTEDNPTDTIVSLLELVIEADADSARECLAVLATKIQSGELSGRRLEQLKPRLQPLLAATLKGKPSDPLYFDAHLLAASWGNSPSAAIMRATFADARQDESRRLRAFSTLVATHDKHVLQTVDSLLARAAPDSKSLRAAVLAALGSLPDPGVAGVILKHYDRLEPELRPKAIETLLQRTDWSNQLLEAIGRGRVPQQALHRNQVARLLASRDAKLVALVRSKWGTVRTERNPQREKVLDEMRDLLRRSSGNPRQGKLVFHRVCGQCHRIYGEGQQVGPDITSNGRGSFDQLLSNVFDPSLVIGSSYQARTVITADGRVLTGLVAEDNDQRIVLKLQGGKQEVIARDDIDDVSTSLLSLMPEGLEGQLKPRELIDLFAFLVLDGPPENPTSRLIQGAPPSLVVESSR